VRFARVLPPLLAGATIVLLAANALPASMRRHALQRELRRMQERIRCAEDENARLREELQAIREDPFVLERFACEAWNLLPPGTVRYRDAVVADAPPAAPE